MSETLKPDICVIGAGSGGLSVAAIAAAFGVSCVLVEKHKMGGDCLNYGCVPSKALIAAAKKADSIRHASAFGIDAGEPQVDFARVHAHVHDVIASIAPNDSVARFNGLGVRVIEAAGRFTDKRTLVAGDVEIKARRFVIATGSSPFVPPIPGLDGVSFLTNETIFDLTERPDHLIVIGGGPIGIELAQAHARLGAKVTVIEAMAPLSREDPELAEIVLTAVRADGVTIHTGAPVRRVEREGGGVRVHFGAEDAPDHVDGSHVLVAVGRKPNIADLGLDAAGVETDGKGITTNAALRTTNRHIFAIGDIAGGAQFTHVANYHAGKVIQSILFRIPGKADMSAIPRVTFTDPELAQIGLTEAEARQKHGDRIAILRWPFAENDRAQAERRTSGLVKVVTDRGGRILGASIAGPDAGEQISLWSLALSQKLKVSALRDFTVPYPTLSEVSKRAAVSFYADVPRKPWLRSLLLFLGRFG